MNQVEPHYHPDMAAELDSAAEILADEFGLKRDLAIAIWNRFNREASVERWRVCGPVVAGVLRRLLESNGNLKAMVSALPFSFGLEMEHQDCITLPSMARRWKISEEEIGSAKMAWDAFFCGFNLWDLWPQRQVLSDTIYLLVQPCRNLKGKILGAVFSFGVIDVLGDKSDVDIQSMADEGRRHGVSRALMSHYKREWDTLFGRYGRVFGKSPEACEKNREARLRVLRKKYE
jgi:hypothetical protein